jgi:hypothetical protein
MPTYLD